MNNKEYEVKIIRREGDSVRVVDEDGVAMFSITDFLKTCGYSSYSKKAQLIAKDIEHPGVKKLLKYRCITERGPRTFKMYFFDKKAAFAVLNDFAVSPDTKKWLENTVLSYKPSAKEKTEEATELVREAAAVSNLSALNSAIDRLLIDVIELKKQVILSE